MSDKKDNYPQVWIRLGIILAVLIILAAVWRWSPLGDWLSVEKLVEFTDKLSDDPYAPLIVLTAFITGSLVAFPLTVLIGATALIFNPFISFLYSSAGSFAGAAASYVLGSLLGRNTVRRMAGSRLEEISRFLARRGALTVAIARNLPVVPFTVLNVAAGASHIRFRDYMTGTVLGMLPGLVGITLFSNRLRHFLENPSGWMLLVLIALAGGLVLGGYLLIGYLKRKYLQSGGNIEAGGGDILRAAGGPHNLYKPVRNESDSCNKAQQETQRPGRRIRVATYNIHGWVGTDGRKEPGRILDLIDKLDAAVIALQEVELPVPSTNCGGPGPQPPSNGAHGDGGASSLEELTGMKVITGPTLRRGKGTYGNVILSEVPVVSSRRFDLTYRDREPRGGLDVELRLNGRVLRVVSTHLGLLGRERHWQVVKLLEILRTGISEPLVLMGDFNEWIPFSRAMRKMHKIMHGKSSPRSYPSRFPLLPLDRIWAGNEAILDRVWTFREPAASKASDHLPVAADIEL